MPATPAVPVGYSQFLSQVAGGQVTSVVQEGDILTVKSSAPPNTYTVVVPSILTQVFNDMVLAADKGGHPLDPRSSRPSRRPTPRGSACS